MKQLEPTSVCNANCSHYYHTSCLSVYIKKKLSDNCFPFRCPVRICRRPLSRESAVKVISDPDLVFDYDYLNFLNRIGKGKKSLVYCKHCK